MTATLQEVADDINALFRKYGLDHDVVAVRTTIVSPPNPIHLDPRENESDLMKWRSVPGLDAVQWEEVVLHDSTDTDRMRLLLTTLQYVFDVFFQVQPPSNQLRLF